VNYELETWKEPSWPHLRVCRGVCHEWLGKTLNIRIAGLWAQNWPQGSPNTKQGFWKFGHDVRRQISRTNCCHGIRNSKFGCVETTTHYVLGWGGGGQKLIWFISIIQPIWRLYAVSYLCAARNTGWLIGYINIHICLCVYTYTYVWCRIRWWFWMMNQ
jgi:hypothetical protein